MRKTKCTRVAMPEHISAILRRVLKTTGLKEARLREDVARTFLSCLTGGQASHVEVLAFRNNVLTIGVDSSTHCYDLSNFHKERLLSEMRQNVPGNIFVRDIRFCVSRKVPHASVGHTKR